MTGSSPSESKPITLSIIKVYAPTSTASDDDLGYFYNQLQDTLDGIPKRDIIMITGDFNAKVGEGVQHEMKPWQWVRMAWEVEMREVAHLLTSA